MPRHYLVTGAAGFIGMHTAERLLQRGDTVVGLDNLNDYYDPALKLGRLDVLNKYPGFRFIKGDLVNRDLMTELFSKEQFDGVVHLAAQAGVRYSIDNPRAYLDANIVGTFNVMEVARTAGVQHLLMASTSSVYGANTEMPFTETERVATPLTFYAASKLANEGVAIGFEVGEDKAVALGFLLRQLTHTLTDIDEFSGVYRWGVRVPVNFLEERAVCVHPHRMDI